MVSTPNFDNTPFGAIKPATQMRAVTPGASAFDNDLGFCRALWVQVGGTLVATLLNDTAPVTITVPDNSLLPMSFKALGAASTATGIFALY